jgi:hypothetical protein
LIATIAFVGLFATQFSYAQAETNTEGFQSDFEFETVSVCGGEALRLGGTAHFTFHETISADGSSHQSTKMNYQKVGGVGLESGDRYQLNEVRSSIVQDNKENKIVHSVITGTLIGQGKLANTKVTINLLIVFDEDGNPKTSVDKIDFKCQG